VSEIPFHGTRMGRTFYEHTVPDLVSQLARLNENIERLVEAAETTPTSVKGDDDD